MVRENDYIYTAVKGTCNSSLVKSKVIAKISGWTGCLWEDCSDGRHYNFLSQGPLVVLIDAGTRDFALYRGGILNTSCSSPSHAVTGIGYGIENNEEYILIRNSWSQHWGIQGNAKVKRDPLNKASCYTEYYGLLPYVEQ
jgi:hypothetical protein